MENKKEITSHEIKSSSTIKSNNEIILIFNNSQDEIDNIPILNILFIIIIYVCFEFLKDIFYQCKNVQT